MDRDTLWPTPALRRTAPDDEALKKAVADAQTALEEATKSAADLQSKYDLDSLMLANRLARDALYALPLPPPQTAPRKK